MTTMPTPSSTSMSRNARIWRVVDPQVVTVARVGRDPRPWMRTQTLTSRLDTSRPAQRGRTTSIGGTSLAVGHRVAYWATPQPDRPAGGTSGRGNDHEVLIRVLTGNIRPCFRRRPDEPSTALHHHLANRDHWHHKEIGVDRGPAIIAPGFTRTATTAQREQRRFLTDRGRAPRLAKVAQGGRLRALRPSLGALCAS